MSRERIVSKPTAREAVSADPVEKLISFVDDAATRRGILREVRSLTGGKGFAGASEREKTNAVVYLIRETNIFEKISKRGWEDTESLTAFVDACARQDLHAGRNAVAGLRNHFVGFLLRRRMLTITPAVDGIDEYGIASRDSDEQDCYAGDGSTSSYRYYAVDKKIREILRQHPALGRTFNALQERSDRIMAKIRGEPPPIRP